MRFFRAVISILALAVPNLALAQDEMEPETSAPVEQHAPAARPAEKIQTGKADTSKAEPAKSDAAKTDAPDVPLSPPGTMSEMPVAELQALDKITARVSRLAAKVGETVTFGSLNIVVKACRKAPPEDPPEAAAFLQIWEQKPGEESHWVYSGWMFASSPALAAMDHPVYDIWVVDCTKVATSDSSSTPAK